MKPIESFFITLLFALTAPVYMAIGWVKSTEKSLKFFRDLFKEL